MPKLCEYENCKKRASYGFIENALIMCREHKTSDMKNISYFTFKKCICGLHLPTFNYKGKKPEFCKSCKTDNMIDVVSNKCKCGKCRPTFNYKGLKAEYCKSCKEETMINVKDNKCNCGKHQPSFNYEGLKAEYCKSCKKDNMVNVKDDKCKCGLHQPNFNYEGLQPQYCNSCKLENMVDVKKPKCIKCNIVTPVFNYEGLKPEYCKKCKEEDMVNVVDKKCIKCNIVTPVFNYEGLHPQYCNSCKLENMVNVVSKKCNCGKVVSFNFPGLFAEYCSLCKKDGMVIVRNNDGRPPCKNTGCLTESNKKYKNYCAYCFQHLFPLDPLTFQIRCKTKEIAVRDFINLNFDGFQHDKPLEYGGCDCQNRRRIDHRKLLNNTLLCIETDENQHKKYSKKDEENRYNDLLATFTCKYIFIRFNPDSYINKKGKKYNPSIALRLISLKQEIEKQIERINNEENTELIEIKYLYFDNYN